MNGRRWIQAGGAAMALILFAAVLVWFVYDQSSRRIPTAQVVVPESPSAPDRAGGRELLAPYTDAAPPTPAPATPPRPMRWIASPQPAVMTMPGEPPLELARRQAENQHADGGGIEISSDVVCAVPLAVETVSPTHFKLRFNREGFNNYFLFKVSGAAGQLVRFDFEQTEITRRERKWWSLNPVYSYVTDLDDPASFVSEPPPAPARPVLAWNGPLLPDTRGQKWHYVPDVWEENGHLCWVMRFEEDHAYVAMRPPYTPGYNERFLKQVAQSPHARVLTIGHSPEGRPLQIVQVGDTAGPKPAVLVYAREHPSEQDPSWIAEGVIRFLLSGGADNDSVRQRVTFLVIPVLDPDGAAAGWYARPDHRFVYDGFNLPEPRMYARFLREWVSEGDREVYLALDLHNVESAEFPHLMCVWMPPDPWFVLCQAFHARVRHGFERAGFNVSGVPAQRVMAHTRLGGHAFDVYGALHLLYEANSQASQRHLTLGELRDFGRHLVKASDEFIRSSHGAEAGVMIGEARQRRLARLERHRWAFEERGITEVLQVEWTAWVLDRDTVIDTVRKALAADARRALP